jgi:cellulose biosynthesis protein BcsQ
MARPDGPVSVCLISLKGGVGKSTICALLARRAYTRRPLDVLAVDLDAQAHLSQALMHNDYDRFLLMVGMEVDRVIVAKAPVCGPEIRPSAVVEKDQAAERPDVRDPVGQRAALTAPRHLERHVQVP